MKDPFWKKRTVDFFRSLYNALQKTVLRFVYDRCSVEAKALSYVSLLTFIPLTVVLLFVISRFPLFPLVKNELFSNISEYFLPEKAKDIVCFIEGVVENFRSIGNLGLFFSAGMVFSLLIAVGNAVNRIWKQLKIKRYFITFVKFLIIVVSSPCIIVVIFYLQNHLSLRALSQHIPWSFPFDLKITKLYSLTLHWIFITLIYFILPNARVRFFYSFLAGAFAGTLWYCIRAGLNAYVRLIPQIDILYGSVAFIPILIIWIYLFWMIVLFGVELNYTFHFELNELFYKMKQNEEKGC